MQKLFVEFSFIFNSNEYNAKNIDEKFSSGTFTSFINPILYEIKNKYDIIILIDGNKKNIDKKRDWLKKESPFVSIDEKEFIKLTKKEEVIFIGGSKIFANKKIKLRLLFNDNKVIRIPGVEAYFVNNWEEVSSILNFYEKYDFTNLNKK